MDTRRWSEVIVAINVRSEPVSAYIPRSPRKYSEYWPANKELPQEHCELRGYDSDFTPLPRTTSPKPLTGNSWGHCCPGAPGTARAYRPWPV